MPGHKKVFLEITNCCNLSCSFCPGCSRPPHVLSEDEFRLLADRCAGWADYLYFHLMGEPLSHPHLPEFIRYTHTLGLRPMLTTNGTLLPSRGAALLREDCQPYKISISLHAFEANDIPMSFEDYLTGCTNFAAEASARGIITVLRLWNLEGEAAGAKHALNDAVLAHLHRAFPDAWTENRSGLRLRDHLFLEWGKKFDWPTMNDAVRSDTGFCYALRDQIGILCDGTVVPCCLDADGTLALGNLFRENLDEILNGDRAKSIYDGFTEHRCEEELCKRCMRASSYRR